MRVYIASDDGRRWLASMQRHVHDIATRCTKSRAYFFVFLRLSSPTARVLGRGVLSIV